MKPKLYLSGSIEHATDPDAWRKKMFKSLYHRYDVFVPKEARPPFDKNDPIYKEWIYENFIIPDISQVAISPYLFVKFDSAVFKGAGTVSEVTIACWMGKHIVYTLDNLKEEDIPGWALGCLVNGIRVDSIEDAINYYKDMNEPYKDPYIEKL